MVAKSFDDLVAAVFARRRILIQAYDAGLGIQGMELLFYLFSTRAEILDVFTATGWTEVRHFFFCVTVMTAQDIPIFVIDHSYIARITFDYIATFAAHDF